MIKIDSQKNQLISTRLLSSVLLCGAGFDLLAVCIELDVQRDRD
jgi:hypothetical protein